MVNGIPAESDREQKGIVYKISKSFFWSEQEKKWVVVIWQTSLGITGHRVKNTL